MVTVTIKRHGTEIVYRFPTKEEAGRFVAHYGQRPAEMKHGKVGAS